MAGLEHYSSLPANGLESSKCFNTLQINSEMAYGAKKLKEVCRMKKKTFKEKEGRKRGNVLFNDALNTFTVIWHQTYG